MTTFVTYGCPSPYPPEGWLRFLIQSQAAEVRAVEEDNGTFTVTVDLIRGLPDNEAADRFIAGTRAYAKWLHDMPYAQYLDSDEWRATREQAMWRAGWKCEKCGLYSVSGRGLQVHHLTYERRGYEAPEDLQVLCAGCHKMAHGRDG